MYGDQFGEFVGGYWDLKGLSGEFTLTLLVFERVHCTGQKTLSCLKLHNNCVSQSRKHSKHRESERHN